MSWIQWRLRVRGDDTESLENQLLDLGALSITYQDAADRPVLEPDPGEVRLWEDVYLIALFEADVDCRAITEQLAASEFQDATAEQSWEALEDKDWIRAWMDDYQPMQFGQTLWICPTWCEPPEPDAVNLMLDPGLAFGTGTHPTTSLCLNFLEDRINGGEQLIDYGCGSGVLGLAAAKLGAKQVIGVDHDPQAIIASRANAELNGVSSEQFSVFTTEHFQPIEADGVIANILATTLKSLVNEIVTLVKPGGWIALSGVLESQLEAVQAVYSPWIRFDEPVLLEEWALLTGTKIS